MYNGGTGFLILLLGDPHGLEGGEGTEDGASDPDEELALGRGDDLDLHGAGGEGSHFLAESLGDAGVHGGSSGHDDVAIEVLSDVHVALHDGLVTDLMESGHLLADEHGLEEGLGASESLAADGDGLAVGQLVGLVVLGGVVVGLNLALVVQSHVAELLLDVSDGLRLSGRAEVEADFVEQLPQVFGEVAAGQVVSLNGVGESVALIDGHSVGDTISSVQHQTGGSSGGVEGQHGLDSQIIGGNFEGFEHDFGHFFSVGLGISGG